MTPPFSKALILVVAIAAAAVQAREIAITVDDLPSPQWRDLKEVQAVNRAMLEVLRAHRVPAVGFRQREPLAG